MSHITPLSQVIESIKQTKFAETPFEFLSKPYLITSLHNLHQIGLIDNELKQRIDNMKNVQTYEDLDLIMTLYMTICKCVGALQIMSYNTNQQTTKFQLVEGEQLRSIKSMFTRKYPYHKALHFVSVFTFRFHKLLQDIVKTKTNKYWKAIEHSTKFIKEPDFVKTNVDFETCQNAIKYVKEIDTEPITEPITESITNPIVEPVAEQVSDITTKTVIWGNPVSEIINTLENENNEIANNDSFIMQCVIIGGFVGSCLLIANYFRK